MSRKSATISLILTTLFFATGTIFAAEGQPETSMGDKTFFFSVVVASCAFAMAIASSACGIAQSRAISRAMDGIARQPSSYKDIQTLLIIGLALIESLALYVLVVALILIYASPFNSIIAG